MSFYKKITYLLFTVVAGLSMQGAGAAGPSDYPDKPIRFVVPYPAGAGNDILARLITKEMSAHFGQPVIVENRSGAAGAIGLSNLARSPADGYSIGLGDAGPLAINPSLYPSLPYDPLKDFAPISTLGSYVYVLVVNAKLPVHTVGELIDYAKKHPGELNYASSGNGSVVHLATEMFKQRTGIDVLHIPFKASPEALLSVAGGEKWMMLVNIQAVKALVNAGTLRALAVVSAQRSPTLPDVPTIAEAGLSDFKFSAWFGVLAPAGTPEPIVNALSQEINRILRLPSIVKTLQDMGGVQVGGLTPTEFSDLIRSENKVWGDLVRSTGAKVD